MILSQLAFFADDPPAIVDWSPWHHTAGGNHNFGFVLYNGGTMYIDELYRQFFVVQLDSARMFQFVDTSLVARRRVLPISKNPFLENLNVRNAQLRIGNGSWLRGADLDVEVVGELNVAYNRGADDHVYRENAHMASHWAMISMDLSLTTTNAERKAKAKTVYTNINDGMPSYGGGSLHKLMRKQSDGSYVFFGDFDGKSNRLEDVSHGNAVIAYTAHANALGISVSRLEHIIWQGGSRDPQWNWWVGCSVR